MLFTHTITQAVSCLSGQVSAGSKQYSAASVLEFDESVAASATDFLVNIAFPVANVKSFFLLADKDILLETNNSGAPVNTLSLKANIAYYWNTDSYDTFKLTTDVTKFYFTNAGGTAVVVKCRVLLDPTPTGGV